MFPLQTSLDARCSALSVRLWSLHEAQVLPLLSADLARSSSAQGGSNVLQEYSRRHRAAKAAREQKEIRTKS